MYKFLKLSFNRNGGKLVQMFTVLSYLIFFHVKVCRAVLVEYVELFNTKESMGMQLSNSLVVRGFGTTRKNVISIAEAKGTIRPGDKIISLNKQNDKSYRSSKK